MSLRAPTPWFGGKRRAAELIWSNIGHGVGNLLIPFAGMLGEWLAAPGWAKRSVRHLIVNDADGFICNLWRAMHQAPEDVAEWACWPVMEPDLHARHAWLVGQRENLTGRLIADPEWYDAKIAGWWVWGASQWIGGQWCRGRPEIAAGRGSKGVHRGRPEIAAGRGSKGVHRGLPEIAAGRGSKGVHRGLPEIQTARHSVMQGIHVKRPQIATGGPRGGPHAGREVVAGYQPDRIAWLTEWFQGLASDLEAHGFRATSGDFSRVLGPSVIADRPCAVILDPPYATHDRNDRLYAMECEDEIHVSERARRWAVEHGEEDGLRIALCGYEGHYDMPAGWWSRSWVAQGGMGNRSGNANRFREVVWFSPGCRPIDQEPPAARLAEIDGPLFAER